MTLEPLPLKPISQRSVSTAVVTQVLDLIRTGTLRRGQQLPPETALADQFEVSRSSIREALKALRVLGILESKPGVGSFVKEDRPSRAVLAILNEWAEKGSSFEIMEARRALEPYIVLKAAERRTDDDLRAMEDFIKLLETQIGQNELSLGVDLEYHLLLAVASHNHVLVDCMRMIVARMQEPLRKALRAESLATEGRLASYVAQHKAIYAAISRQDGEQAARLMLKHLEEVDGALEEVGLL